MGPVFTPLGVGGARAVSAREAQGDAQAVGVIFSGGTAAVAVHGFGNQCQAEAAVFFAVQGVVVLKEARQGVVGDGGCGAVVQTEGGVAAGLCNSEGRVLPSGAARKAVSYRASSPTTTSRWTTRTSKNGRCNPSTSPP